MKILVVHNFYQQPGGEDGVFADETALLQSRGHDVLRHTVHNDEVDRLTRLTLAGKTIWNGSAAAHLAEIVRRERIDVAHFHNTFPLLSPAVYGAARSAGAAVVQTLHNYRLLCPKAIFYRDGKVCEDCLGRTVAWPGVLHRCYRDNLSASAVSAAMLGVHRVRGTYAHDVDRYVALTEFARGKFLQGGLPADRIVVKPNFVWPDPGPRGGGTGAVFVGRLTESKGVRTLLDAWKQLALPVPLDVVGDGELAGEVRDAAAADSRIRYLGRQSTDAVYRILGLAGALVFPSVWYEGLPKTILESFAVGTPVVASELGSMSELIRDGETGRLFTPGDPASLASAVHSHFSQPTQPMRVAARAEFEAFYTAEANDKMLVEVYEGAMENRKREIRYVGT